MNKQQEALLNKIALNKHSAVNGKEPNKAEDTKVPIEFVLESNLDRVTITSLFRFKWVTLNDKDDTIALTELGFQIFEEI